jgi:hypothetical protein
MAPVAAAARRAGLAGRFSPQRCLGGLLFATLSAALAAALSAQLGALSAASI